MKLFANTAKAVCVSAAVAFSSLAFAGGNPDGVASVTVTSASGLPGAEVEVQVVFGHTGSTQALTVDMEFDPAFYSNVDLSDCVELIAPTQNAAACFVRNPPNDNQIRINLLNVPTPGDVADGPFGTMRFTIDPGATVGDSTEIRIIDVVLERFPDLDLTAGVIDVISGPPAELGVSPPSINFGGVRIGETSAESPIAICNDADPGADPAAADLNVTGISVTGTGFAEGAGSTCAATPFNLAPGACCNFHVTFSPDAEASFSGNVAIESSVGDADVALSGQGTVSDANLELVSGNGDFGTRDINAGANSETFVFRNSGTDDALENVATTLTGDGFTQVSTTCAGTLAPGATCQVVVEFDADTADTFNGNLNVAGDGSSVDVALVGIATATANIGVNPPFGPVSLGVAAPGTVLTANGAVSNTGSAAADVSCVLTGDTGVISTNPSPLAATVAPGATVPFSLACALPDDADDGVEFSATLTCSVDGVEAGVHDLSCGVQAFQPIPINTLQPLGLALFALLMLMIGGISIRLFRAS